MATKVKVSNSKEKTSKEVIAKTREKDERFEFRVNSSIKEKAKKASILLDKNLTDYLTDLIDRDSTIVISNHQNTVLENDIFDRFMEACSTPPRPNKALIKALKNTRKKGF
ncbi:MAG: DUF1778 domain-containing protein [Candidatus Sericytochromatia bacterium]